jgi:hypothetical protein
VVAPQKHIKVIRHFAQRTETLRFPNCFSPIPIKIRPIRPDCSEADRTARPDFYNTKVEKAHFGIPSFFASLVLLLDTRKESACPSFIVKKSPSPRKESEKNVRT